MPGAALELALALHRIPSMRNVLREQPLPPDTGELLTLVAGSPEAVAAAARNCGEAPATVQEAARFFVQEVMLFPGADAYRLLGAQRGADDALLKAHYRALQSWLHPDRRGNDLKSTYAARINSAWGRLRTPERRLAYDAMLDGERAPSSSMAQAQGPAQVLVRVQGWDAQAERSPPWKIIVPVMAILTLCVLLGWKVSRDTATRAGQDLWSRGPVAAAPVEEEAVLIMVPSLSARTGEATAVSATPSLPLDETADPPILAIADSLPLPFPASPSPGALTTTQAAASLSSAAADPSFLGTLPPAHDADRELLPRASLARISEPIVAVTPPIGASPPVPAPGIGSEALSRAKAAERRADDLWAYLGGQRASPPPIWRSVAAMDAADRVRRDLAGATPSGQVRPAFSQAQWQVGNDQAKVWVQVTPSRGSDPMRVRADLGWRDGQWWVEQVSLEQNP